MTGRTQQRKVLLDVTLVVGATGISAGLAFFGLIHLKKKYIESVSPYKYRAWNAMPKALRESEWATEIQTAAQAALAAGKEIKAAAEKDNKTIEYKGSIDLVTETDKNNEAQIIKTLQTAFPTHKFIGEESASGGGIPALTQELTWIIDPIDGTTNFVHGFPFSCVSIALAKGGQIVAAIVYDPYKDELFLGAKGQGAYLNGRKLKTSGVSEPLKASVIQEFGYERTPQGISRLLHMTKTLLQSNLQSLRQLGCGVLDLAYIAAGRVDAVYTGLAGEGWKPWDYAAGSLLAQEAGAVIKSLDGKPFDLYGSNMVCASTEELCQYLINAATLANGAAV